MRVSKITYIEVPEVYGTKKIDFVKCIATVNVGDKQIILSEVKVKPDFLENSKYAKECVIQDLANEMADFFKQEIIRQLKQGIQHENI